MYNTDLLDMYPIDYNLLPENKQAIFIPIHLFKYLKPLQKLHPLNGFMLQSTITQNWLQY